MRIASLARALTLATPLLTGIACTGSGPTNGSLVAALAVVVAPAATAQSGVPLVPQPVLQLVDAAGQPVALSKRLVTAVLITSGPTPGATLTGTREIRTDAAGRASFTDLAIVGLVGTWSLRFDSPGLPSETSSPIGLAAGPAALLLIATGNLQTSVAGTAVPIAPGVRVTDGAGNPLPGIPVSFAANNGGGVEGAATETNADGFAAPARWTLGTDIGLNTLTATSTLLPGVQVSFTATGTVGPPASITIVAGDGQSATVGADVPLAPSVRLRDAFGHLLAGVTLNFVAAGGGTVDPASVLTDANGVATVHRWTLGLPPGPNTLTASFGGTLPVAFTANGLIFAVSDLAAGTGHSCALDPAGAAFCWGLATSGQLGTGTFVNLTVPTAVGGGQAFTAISAGDGHSCALTAGGDAWCWGNNGVGQLGDGTTVAHAVPAPVAGGFKFSAVRASAGFTCGLELAGTARCWGFNADGQLGDGTTTVRTTPTPVSGGELFAALSAGVGHTCGLKLDATLLCWGFNGNGQLGDGTKISRTTPTAVSSALSFSAVSAGGSHSCALTTSGAGYCWGDGSLGRLGTGTLTERLTPAAVSGTQSFTQLSVHASQSCALTASGQAWCWGFNGAGQLGDLSFTNRLVPTAVAGGLSYTLLAAGSEHTCGRATNGGAYCWGRNDTGAVGDETMISRRSPVGVFRPLTP